MKELGANLTLNAHTLESVIVSHEETMRQIDVIIDYMEGEIPISDSIRLFLDRARWSDNIDLSPCP